MSFFYYLTKREIYKFNNNPSKRRNFDVYDIGFKFPLIHYILESQRPKSKQVFNEAKLDEWFIKEPYTILSKKIYPGVSIIESTLILPAEQVFIEEPVVVDEDVDNEFAYRGYGGSKRKTRKLTKRRKLTNRRKLTKRRKNKH